MSNNFKVIGGRQEYGGQVVQLQFDSKPTHDEIDKAVMQLDPFNFGYRILSQGETWITVKVHND